MQVTGDQLLPTSAHVISSILSMPFAENTYIAHFEGRDDCIIVDPGLEPGKILAYLDEHRLTPTAILCTHGHADHIGGNGMLKDRWPHCPLVIGAGDAHKLIDAEQNLSAGFGVPIVSPPADETVTGGDEYDAAGFTLSVLDTPGHSAGHVSFLWRAGSPQQVFDGDVLMQRTIGRTDFPDGDFEALTRAIHERLFSLPDDTIVLPGHGEATTIGEEKRENPFVGI